MLVLGEAAAAPQVNLEPAGAVIGVWCPSSQMCFAAGVPKDGPPAFVVIQLFQSSNRGAANPIWKRTLSIHTGINAVACPAARLCLAAEENGMLLVGTAATRASPGRRLSA